VEEPVIFLAGGGGGTSWEDAFGGGEVEDSPDFKESAGFSLF